MSKLCEHTEEISTGNLSVDIYREHLKVRQILITSDITEESVNTIALQIMKFNEEDDELEQTYANYDRSNNPITLKIASFGGSASACLSIVSQITQSLTPVIGVAVGDCSSAGAIILLCCHARFSSIYSTIMVHSMMTGVHSSLQGVIDHVEESNRLQGIIDGIITSRTKITQKMLTDIQSKKKDWYMSSAEALEWGVVDFILPVGIEMPDFKDRNKSKAKTRTKKVAKPVE